MLCSDAPVDQTVRDSQDRGSDTDPMQIEQAIPPFPGPDTRSATVATFDFVNITSRAWEEEPLGFVGTALLDDPRLLDGSVTLGPVHAVGP